MTSNETDYCLMHTYFGVNTLYTMVSIGFVSICESLVVIFVTYFKEKLHHNTCILVASLAVNDLLLTASFIGTLILVVPLGLSKVMKPKLLMCFLSGLSSATTNMSVAHMGVIAVDRYIQIVHPFYYMKEMTKTRTYAILLSLWISCLIFTVIPPTIFYDDKYHKRCILLHPPEVYLYIQITAYFICIICVFVCYFKIAHVAFKHKKSANSRRLRYHESQADTELRDNVKAAVRSVKFFILMFGVLFMCTFPPYFATALSFRYTIPSSVTTGLFSLVPIHSVINFFIYTYMNKEFSASLLIIVLPLKRLCCKDGRMM